MVFILQQYTRFFVLMFRQHDLQQLLQHKGQTTQQYLVR